MSIIIISLSVIYILFCLVIFFFQEKVIFQPEKLAPDFKFAFDFTFDERNYNTNNGVINALHFTTPHPKGVILFFHGNAGSLRTWGYTSKRFTHLGYNLLMIDYRGYGKSMGVVSEQALFNDALSIYDSLVLEYGEPMIHVYGRSLGSAIAVYVASVRKPAQCILEAPFFSMVDLIQHYIPWIPTFLIRYPFRTDEYIEKITCPVYLFHGIEDKLIYFGSSVKLSKKLHGSSHFFAITGGGHNNLSRFDDYYNNLMYILN